MEIPLPPARTGSCYARLEYRRQMEIAVVGATAVLTLDEHGQVSDARVAITALAPTIRRVPEAEAALVGTDAGPAERDHRRPGDRRRVSADQRRARLGRLSQRDGRGDRAPSDRGGRGPRPRPRRFPFPPVPTLHGGLR